MLASAGARRRRPFPCCDVLSSLDPNPHPSPPRPSRPSPSSPHPPCLHTSSHLHPRPPSASSFPVPKPHPQPLGHALAGAARPSRERESAAAWLASSAWQSAPWLGRRRRRRRWRRRRWRWRQSSARLFGAAAANHLHVLGPRRRRALLGPVAPRLPSGSAVPGGRARACRAEPRRGGRRRSGGRWWGRRRCCWERVERCRLVALLHAASGARRPSAARRRCAQQRRRALRRRVPRRRGPRRSSVPARPGGAAPRGRQPCTRLQAPFPTCLEQGCRRRKNGQPARIGRVGHDGVWRLVAGRHARAEGLRDRRIATSPRSRSDV